MDLRLFAPPLPSGLCRATSYNLMIFQSALSKCYERSWHVSIMLAFIALVLSSCSGMQTTTNTDRSTWEQLLLSQSLTRTLDSARIPLDPGASVSVKTAGLTDDKDFAQDLVVGWLREKGLQVQSEDGTYLIRVILHAFGTEQSESFVGLPAIESTIIPIALPELSLYKATKQRGYSRLQLEISDTKNGALIASSPIYEDDVYFNQYIFLLAFGRTSTDISPPPL